MGDKGKDQLFAVCHVLLPEGDLKNISMGHDWAENVQQYHLASAKNRAEKQFINIMGTLQPNVIGKVIVLQRTTTQEQTWRIIACLIDNELIGHSENGTNYINIPDEINARNLLCLLNSSLIDFVFRHINSKTHVSSSEINSLPIILSNIQQSQILDELYMELSTKKIKMRLR